MELCVSEILAQQPRKESIVVFETFQQNNYGYNNMLIWVCVCVCAVFSKQSNNGNEESRAKQK